MSNEPSERPASPSAPGPDSGRRPIPGRPDRTALVDGTELEGYRLSFLTVGGMSVVYLGEPVSGDGPTIVIKEVAASNSRDVPSLVSEKSLLERLDHPRIPKLVGFWTHPEQYYLGMERVEGSALSQWLQGDQPPPVPTVLDWGLQLCEIFAYLHSLDPPVIYRDLKPENAILSPDGEVHLIDFGIARVHKGDREADTSLLGSPATASPEHYGGTETDERSDIYTLGATLYELLTGGRTKRTGPFSHAPVSELRPEVSPAVEAALAKALAFRPEDRYQRVEELGRALAHAVGFSSPALRLASVFAADEASEQPHPHERSETVSLRELGVEVPTYRRSRRPLVLGLLLVGLMILGGLHLYVPGLIGSQPNVSFESSLQGELFAADQVGGQPAVLFGEDIGLFPVTGWREQEPHQRAEAMARRLSSLYRTPCSLCNKTKLEPEDIRLGEHEETGEVVVFYVHQHADGRIWAGPDLLATVDSAQAQSLQSNPVQVGAYWRDLMRDLVNLSRGRPAVDAGAPEALNQAMTRAREQLNPEESSVANLRTVLAELTGSEALLLRDQFLQIPERDAEADHFEAVQGYRSLVEDPQ